MKSRIILITITTIGLLTACTTAGKAAVTTTSTASTTTTMPLVGTYGHCSLLDEGQSRVIGSHFNDRIVKTYQFGFATPIPETFRGNMPYRYLVAFKIDDGVGYPVFAVDELTGPSKVIAVDPIADMTSGVGNWPAESAEGTWRRDMMFRTTVPDVVTACAKAGVAF